MPRGHLIRPSGAFGILSTGAFAVTGEGGVCPECCGEPDGGPSGPCECSVETGHGRYGLAPAAEPRPFGALIDGWTQSGEGVYLRVRRKARIVFQGVTIIDDETTTVYRGVVFGRNGCRVSWRADRDRVSGPSVNVTDPFSGGRIVATLGSDFSGGLVRPIHPTLEVVDSVGPRRRFGLGNLRERVWGSVPVEFGPGAIVGGLFWPCDLAVEWPVMNLQTINVQVVPVELFSVEAQTRLVTLARQDGVAPGAFVQISGEPANPATNPAWTAASLVVNGSESFGVAAGRIEIASTSRSVFSGAFRAYFNPRDGWLTSGTFDAEVEVEMAARLRLTQCVAGGSLRGSTGPEDPRVIDAAERLLRGCKGCGER